MEVKTKLSEPLVEQFVAIVNKYDDETEKLKQAKRAAEVMNGSNLVIIVRSGGFFADEPKKDLSATLKDLDDGFKEELKQLIEKYAELRQAKHDGMAVVLNG